ncbi:metallophosphoesterase family protein [Myxococcota bacterium]|nr:metallophosphoesterase family protein [Myxococcota bacterium]
MRIALFSDVHGNVAALDAVLARIDTLGVDRIFALGDLVGRGPDPEGVVARLRERRIPTIRGNWDEWIAGAPGWEGRPKRQPWVEAGRALVKKKTAAWLASQPAQLSVELDGATLLLAHGSPRDPVELLWPETSDDDLRDALAGVDADVVAIGHSHRPFVRRVGDTLVVNTGTVGYPFDGDPRASFALVELSASSAPRAEATVCFVPYPVDAHVRAMKKLVKRGVLEPRMAQRHARALLGEGDAPTGRLLASDRGAEALVKLLARRIRTTWEDARFDALAEDPRGVKAIRVSVRELREALVLARPLVAPKALDRVLDHLTALGRTLGKLRAAQVTAKLTGRLDGVDAGVRAHLRELSEVRERRLTRTLAADYPRTRRVERGLEALALTMPAHERSTTILEAASALLAFRIERLKELLLDLVDGTGLSRAHHHALRIQLRRLVHAAELLEEPFPSLGFASLAARAAAAHAPLGGLNDHLELLALVDRPRTARLVARPGSDARAIDGAPSGLAPSPAKALDQLRTKVLGEVRAREAAASIALRSDVSDLIRVAERIHDELR